MQAHSFAGPRVAENIRDSKHKTFPFIGYPDDFALLLSKQKFRYEENACTVEVLVKDRGGPIVGHIIHRILALPPDVPNEISDVCG